MPTYTEIKQIEKGLKVMSDNIITGKGLIGDVATIEDYIEWYNTQIEGK